MNKKYLYFALKLAKRKEKGLFKSLLWGLHLSSTNPNEEISGLQPACIVYGNVMYYRQR